MFLAPDRALPYPAAVREWLERHIDTLLPRQCVLCGLASGRTDLCPSCLAELPRPGHVCRSCALPLPLAVDALCGRCLRHPPPWERVVAALDYRFPVDRLVCRFKFGRDFSCGHLLGIEMLAAVRRSGATLPDLVAPVPLHRARHHARCFNQADILARQLSRALGIPADSHLLYRRRNTRAQSGLDAADRKRNTRGAFVFRGPGQAQPAGLRVALVDDVMTTGATVRECVKTLNRAGVARVSVWVAARACTA